MASLTITTSDGSESTFQLSGSRVTVGRSDGNDIVIDDHSISSNHAEIEIDAEGNHQLTDLGSTNGTQVNGERVETATLSDGDNVMLGHLVGTFSISDGAPAAEPTPEPDEPAAGPATTSLAPGSFANASPFTKKVKAKDAPGQALLLLGAPYSPALHLIRFERHSRTGVDRG